MKNLLISFLFPIVIFFPFSSNAQKGITFRIDFIDDSEFLTKNQLRFYIDLLDEDYRVIPKLSSTDIKIFIQDIPEEIKGTKFVQQFSELYEPVAVIFFIAAHREFTIEVSTGKGGAYTPLELIKLGVVNFVKKLGENDKLAIFSYNESGKDRVFPFGIVNVDRVKQNLDEVVKPISEGIESRKGVIISPPFYKFLKEIVALIGEEANLPRRKILIVVSDGLDARIENSSYINTAIDEIVQSSYYLRTKIYCVGFTPSDRRKLINLQTLSEKTGGIYRSPSQVEEIPSMIENIAEEIKKQYVVTFVSDEIDGGKPTIFRMEVLAQGSLKSAQYEEIPLPKKPFPWVRTIIIVISSIVGLIILILFIKALAGYLAERKRRKQEEALVKEKEEYKGPSKGKLTITEGPLAGKVFYITENLINIGSLYDNHIIIDDNSVSKRHASIRIEDLKYELTDLGSTNGVYVNGRKILKQYLRDGDEIKLGNSVMTFNLK